VIRRGVLAFIVAALALTACGANGSSSTSSSSASTSSSSSAATGTAAEFMTGFCSALTDWNDAIQQRSSNFSPDQSNLDALKQSWLDFLDGVNQDTDAMLQEVRALPTPDVPNGSATVSTVLDALEGLGQSFKDLRQESADLPTTSPAEFTQKFQTLVQEFQTKVGDFGSAFQDLQSDQSMESAFSAAPECAALK
jgi:hypothetical protein